VEEWRGRPDADQCLRSIDLAPLRVVPFVGVEERRAASSTS
jgi:hypothetical protein